MQNKKNCPYNNLEHDIYSLKNECNIVLLGGFNARIATKKTTLLSIDSNHNPLWLDEDLVLSNSYKRSSEDLIENLFGTDLVKLCSSQDLIICNGVMKWPNSNQITTFDLLNDHDPDSDHKPLTLTLKFSMHRSTIEENSNKGICVLTKVKLTFS